MRVITLYILRRACRQQLQQRTASLRRKYRAEWRRLTDEVRTLQERCAECESVPDTVSTATMTDRVPIGGDTGTMAGGDVDTRTDHVSTGGDTSRTGEYHTHLAI